MAHVSPIRVIRRTWAWLPLAVLTIMLILFGVAGYKGWEAKQLETRGITGTATILGTERRVSEDSDGRRTYRYYARYSFMTVDGERIVQRRRISAGFYHRLRQGQEVPVRYVEGRPGIHEIEIGATRRAAERSRLMGYGAAVIAAGLAAWVGWRWQGLARALMWGETRQARIVRHIEKPTRRKETGGRYGRIVWVDSTGAEGMSGYVPMLDVVSHPVGCRISVIIDPRSGKGFWDEEFGDDTVGLLQRG